ncbi:MFS transporter small subunit [Sphaerisporangium corydalis]|uniref:Oxalate:formate antiporter n=1 Tax=Sphaerisporangium corydalis TaxID=1441875 RepID=A0ABV9ESM4_9ACTN|nr:hypothetical protein [Sphaerisporangium corydalis]
MTTDRDPAPADSGPGRPSAPGEIPLAPGDGSAGGGSPDTGRYTTLMVLAWAWVGLPFAYGVYELFQKLTQLFGG